MEFIIEPTIARLLLWLGLLGCLFRVVHLYFHTLAQAVLALVLARHARLLGGINVCNLIIRATFGILCLPSYDAVTAGLSTAPCQPFQISE
ncbi:hypothetical protein JAAARDRAFT_32586 [Jaapia argillacea MUCL 33604]|uniref:Uncharacterized protein n=1 Tax=Jaapia argillacea MUCL 33604 TaxID=933084 RepID=A0A067QC91_9AGAM|nr:hypothetical protein JAAARDRAFT_32586 [Jaapia argillacea MUCL 33604]